MKFSYDWLREWVRPKDGAAGVARRLTLAGVETEVEGAGKEAVLSIDFTPNRGDCLSIAGLAREISAIYGVPVRAPKAAAVRATARDSVAVKVDDRKGCSSYHGRVVTPVDPNARTPGWMRERLERSGLRCIHPVVDITNYVMFELGQPLHAFDVAKLAGGIRVRRAKQGERLRLLNEQTIALHPSDLLITDDSGPLALAGVMGGEASGVSDHTTSVFLESAHFDPAVVAATGRRHLIQSDALYRFERGVDPDLQRRALDRAAALIVEICGGAAGAVTSAQGAKPKPVTVRLRKSRLEQLLGYPVPDAGIAKLLKRLGIGVKRSAAGAWAARIPSYRTDLRIEADLIEEVARLHGYERIPARGYPAPLAPARAAEKVRPVHELAERLVSRGYQEVITYSFVEPGLQRQIQPEPRGIPLDNPIAETLSVLRTTLWSGLIPTWQFNAQRQQERVRIFESGVCFREEAGQVIEQLRFGGLAAGPALPEQWGTAKRDIDFFDAKADVEALLGPDADEYRFEPAEHPALHPGQAARVLRGVEPAGWLGVLHPRLVEALDLPGAPVLFELDGELLRKARLPQPVLPSEFPASRRDLALVVREEVTSQALLEQVRRAAGAWLRDTRLFDVYRGKGLPNGCKSVALGLIFQDNSRTLTDQEVDASVQAVVDRLAAAVGASIRK